MMGRRSEAMSKRNANLKTAWIGRRLFGVQWAPDGKWDWTSNVGDRHSDYASVALCTSGPMRFLRITLGPVALLVSSRRGA